VKRPDSRKDLMLAIERRDEAEGERRIMGSLERDFDGGLEGVTEPLVGGSGWPERWGSDLVCGGWGTAEGVFWLRRRVMKSSACLRT
jgi:hypothetical protein